MTSDNLPTISEISGDFDVAEYYDKMNEVVEEMLKGSSPTQIAKTTHLKRRQVVELIGQWQQIARNHNQIRERAGDAIYGADQHYSMIIQKLWNTVEEAENQPQPELRTKTTILKTIADVEQKRIDMLQKAGLLENQDMAQKMVETEQRQEAIMNILREVAADCDHCRAKILHKLADIEEGDL